MATDPDTEQFAVKLSDDKFLYSEYDGYYCEVERKNIRSYKSEIMDMSRFDVKDMQDAIFGYYGSLEEVKEIYGSDWKQIVLECAFE